MASPNTTPRWAAFARDTNETKIQLALNLDGGAFPPETDSRLQVAEGADGHATQASKSQVISISTGIGFLDHMLHALSKHAGWSLALNCKGDLHSQYPHNPPFDHFVRPQAHHCRLSQSTTTTPPKTSASPSATPLPKPSGRPPASRASDTPMPRWTRRSVGP
jgi:hypothetical protein